MSILVSFIGSGRRNEGESETYKRTAYHYDNAVYTTALFTEALLEIRKQDIDSCLLIGTHGSAWGALIEKAAYEQNQHVELFDQLEAAFKVKAVPTDLLTKLEQMLNDEWKITVRCCIHDSEITEEAVLPILYQYTAAFNKEDRHLMVDVTHAFRSMPLILMSALQVLEATRAAPLELEIVYGEFSAQGSSIVRSLAPMWQAVSFGRSLRRFNETFEGEELAACIEKQWPSGASAIQRLGAMLQANFVTQLEICLRQTGNALEDFRTLPTPGMEATLAAEVLRPIHQRLSSKNTFHAQIFELAEMLKERQLWGQAITTLQLSLEAFVFFHYDEQQYGDYEITKRLCSEYSNELPRDDRGKFHRLRNARNAIAHGGAYSKSGGAPQMQNLPTQYQSYAQWLQRIYKKK